MDMWDPYVESVRDHVTEADQKIVFDKFYVSQHLSQAVDQARAVFSSLRRRHQMPAGLFESVVARVDRLVSLAN